MLDTNNIIKQESYTNEFGETMTMALDKDYNLWFKHEDCNEDFENLDDLYQTFNFGGKTFEGLKYVLDSDERKFLSGFITTCTKELI